MSCTSEPRVLSLSRYTIISPVPDSDHDLVLHGLTGAVSLVRRRHVEAIADGAPDQVPPDVRDALAGDGVLTVLTPAEEEELARGMAADLHARNRHARNRTRGQAGRHP